MYREIKLNSKELAGNVSALECGRHTFNRENLAYVTFITPVVTSFYNGEYHRAVKTTISMKMFNILVKQHPHIVPKTGMEYWVSPYTFVYDFQY